MWSDGVVIARSNVNGVRQLRTAIIGGGRISEQHLGVLAKRPDVEVVGVCDLSPALARFTAERFGVPRWFTDHRAMLEEVKPNAVHVLTPAATHGRIARECMEHDAHVIVEKPVALSLEEFDALWDVSRSRGVHLTEDQNYRFNEPVQRLRRLVEEGRLGSIEEVEIRLTLNLRAGGRYADANLPHPSHRLPAGVVHEFISHLCYLLLHFLDSATAQPQVVHARWRNRGGGSLFKYDEMDALVEVGQALGRLRFASHQWPDGFALEVRGTDGVAQAELFHPACQVALPRRVGRTLTPLVNSVAGAGAMVHAGFGGAWRKVRNWTPYEGLARFVDLTYDALAAGDKPPIGHDEMRSTVRLIDELLAVEARA